MIYFVYIINSEVDSSYYIGSTKDIKIRLWEHNFGRTGYTRKKKPWRLVYYEEYHKRGEALKRERYLKRLKSKIFIEKLIENSRSLKGL